MLKVKSHKDRMPILFTEDYYISVLRRSNVDNEYGHHEGGKLHTAITSIDELKNLIDLVWRNGYDTGSQ